jgi:hypothetical protein
MDWKACLLFGVMLTCHHMHTDVKTRVPTCFVSVHHPGAARVSVRDPTVPATIMIIRVTASESMIHRHGGIGEIFVLAPMRFMRSMRGRCVFRSWGALAVMYLQRGPRTADSGKMNPPRIERIERPF